MQIYLVDLPLHDRKKNQFLLSTKSEPKLTTPPEMDEKPVASLVAMPMTQPSTSIPAGVLSNVKPLTQLTVDVSSSSSSSSPLRDEKPVVTASGIGEKRKLEVDVSAFTTTTATADTPPATLEPPDAKFRRAEGKDYEVMY